MWTFPLHTYCKRKLTCYWPSQIIIAKCYSCFKKAAGEKSSLQLYILFFSGYCSNLQQSLGWAWEAPLLEARRAAALPPAMAQLCRISGPLQVFGWTTSSTTSSPCATRTRTWTLTLTASSAASCAWTPCSVSGCPSLTGLPPLLAPKMHCHS